MGISLKKKSLNDNNIIVITTKTNSYNAIYKLRNTI